MNDHKKLLDRLQHSNPEIRCKTLADLTYKAVNASIPTEILDRLIRDRDVRVRESTLEYLQWHTRVNHTDYLLIALADPKVSLQWKAIRHLCQFPDPRAAPFLRSLLSETDPDRRYFLVTALGACDDGQSAAILFDLISDSNTANADVGVSLGKIAKPGMIEKIRLLLDSESPKIVDAAVWALKEIGDAAVVSDLLRCMARNYDNGSCVGSIIWALQKFPNPIAIDSLILASQDERPYVATRAIVALSSYPEPRVVDVLLRYLVNTDDNIRVSAINALKYMPHVTGDLIKGLLAEKNDRLILVFARVLAERGDKSAISALENKLKVNREGDIPDHLRKAIAALRAV